MPNSQDNSQQDNQQQSNISLNANQAYVGINLDNITSQVKPGQYTYALNATISNFDGNAYTIQNESGNILCYTFPAGYRILGQHTIFEQSIIIFWLLNETTGGCEIGSGNMTNCQYTKIINSPCLAFNVDYPILEAVHKITNCSTEVYWTDGLNRKRFIDLNNLPYATTLGSTGGNCVSFISADIDCNKMNVQPDFDIPYISISSVENEGSLQAGSYQFAIQYSNILAEAYTSFYSITNPVSIFDPNKLTEDFNYIVNKAISISISNIDVTGFYDYFNIIVIKTVNAISTPYLVGTYQITNTNQTVIYTGENKAEITETIDDIFQKYPVYEPAQDVSTIGDVLVWADLGTELDINYQQIWSGVTLQWESYRLPGTTPYKDQLNVANYKGYFRDEIYALEGCFLLKNGTQTDSFHIPARTASASDLVPIYNQDAIQIDATSCYNEQQAMPTWQVYNTASVTANIAPPAPDNCYEGPWEYGDFSYWESTDTYPCNTYIWGDLANKPIRHHKFPDSNVTHIHDNSGNIYPLGIRIDKQQIANLIRSSNLTDVQKGNIVGFKIVRGNRDNNKSIIARGLISNVGKYTRTVDNEGNPITNGTTYYFPNYPFNSVQADPFISGTVYDDDSKGRYTFHSPDTSFYQPTLGNVLKLETAEYGQSNGHFVQVKDHAKYKLYSEDLYLSASAVALAIFGASFFIGIGSAGVNIGPAVSVYQVMVDILQRIAPKINYCYSFNSVGTYTNYVSINNTGFKQRLTDIQEYANPGMLSVGDTYNINNFQREGSVYIRLQSPNNTLPYVSDIPSVPADDSRYTISSQGNCANEGNITTRDISSYYATIKNNFVDQYGQLYSYQTIDTGYQQQIDITTNLQPANQFDVIFGGDCFINQFAYKCKLPFFIDNRVRNDDGSDIFYNELGNVGTPNYWFSTDITSNNAPFFDIVFGIPDGSHLDCKGSNFVSQLGKMYLFAYGIQYFYTESQVNVDLRQAYNGKEGDFYPRVSSGIPDDWLQETYVSIANDNSYWYNKSFSKQNEENYFSHIPEDFNGDECRTRMPYRIIFSEEQLDVVNYRRNNWLIYKPISNFDFPENYGKLVGVDGIEDKQVLVRFENKALLYNALLTVPTSGGNAYLGRSLFSKEVPPLDYSDTDLGYVGCQNRFLLKTEMGAVIVDAKRGQVFLLPRPALYRRPEAEELSNSQVNKYLIQNLPFSILQYFPDVNIDNSYKDFGIHGVYDSKFNRIIITKLDYTPLFPANTTYVDGDFFYTDPVTKVKTQIYPTNRTYFCNNSFTLSYSFDSKSWISLHTYLPNYYVGSLNYFFSGININSNANINVTQSTCWEHNTNFNVFNSFYGNIDPYIIEYPYSFRLNDEILQNVKDYTKVLQYFDFQTYIETDDFYFNKAVLWNNQQSSGLLELVKKPMNNLQAYGQYPQYGTTSKTILFTKSDSYYQFNTFWALNKTSQQPMWIKSCDSMSIYKEINQDNMSYGKRSYNKAPIRGRDLKVRLILDNRTDIKMLSEFILSPTEASYK